MRVSGKRILRTLVHLMIIAQEENHIEWIGQLFEAYGLPPDGKVSPVV